MAQVTPKTRARRRSGCKSPSPVVASRVAQADHIGNVINHEEKARDLDML